jgi:3-phenylpropionate/cinnamic acid dioxygenase small subunit
MMASVETAVETGVRVSASSPVFGEIVDFLTDEAYLLDDDKHMEWLDLLTDDVSYRMNRRKTLYRKDGNGVAPGGGFNEDRMSLTLRARRNIEVPSAFDRDPAPRIRRMISNFVVHETETPGEYAVRSAILLLRNRFDQPDYDMLSATRDDVLRKTPDGFRLASRVITPDQARMGAPFPNVFL